MPQVNDFLFPDEIFMVRDDNGKVRYYSKNPFRNPHPAADEIPDIGEYILTFFGEADICNPVQVQISGIRHQHGEQFQAMKLSKILNRTIPYHVEDACGNVINVMLRQESGEYPYIGELLDNKGNVVGKREFDEQGNCSDKRKSHRLMMVKDSASPLREEDTPEEDISQGVRMGKR